jgi:hypothetical protein
MEAVERAVARVRSYRTLTSDTLKAIIESPDFTAATKFWTWPSTAEIDHSLGKERLDLWNLPKNERPLLKKLRDVFKTFGIQPSAESIDRYLHYVKDLRHIRDRRGFEKAWRTVSSTKHQD